MDDIISYGFDPDVVNAWFQDKTQSWEDVQKIQDMDNAAQSQKDIREAADYLKGIADSWVADLSSQ